MLPQIRFLAFALILSPAIFGTTRFSGEKGARPHRTRLSAGQLHTCAVLDDGTVQCWGHNNFGQLGDGSHTARLTPVPVANLGTAISIAAGSLHTCAILSFGTVRCWGFNDSGQLGNGTTVSSNVPVAVSGLTNVVSIAAGFLHTCAVRVDGTVWCWGAAMANGSTGAALVPVKVSLTGAVTVTAGANHTCALLAVGAVKCWGDNTYGQLGGGTTASRNLPVSALGSFMIAADVSAGANFTCARLADAFVVDNYARPVVCWGDNAFGQFGDGTTTASNSPVFSRESDLDVALAAGPAHTCTVRVDGNAACWGRNDVGQLGFETHFSDNLFPNTVPALANVVEIAAGLKHTCAAIADGTIRCWGDNTYGQHGDGITGQVGVDSVVGIVGTFLGRGVTAGNQFPCGRRGSGASACWGAGAQGQLGDSASVSSPNPVAVTGLTNTIAVSAGNVAHACSLDAAGTAKCWGDNSRGQLGNGTTTRSNQPVPVSGGDLFVAISAGDLHTCAIRVGGTIVCWGAGEHGQLGNSGTGDSSVPVQVHLQNAVAIAAGNKFTCALAGDGTVWCWGDNSAGQLGGSSSGMTSLTPGLVPGLGNIVGITAGANHVCAVSAFGSVLCWGANSRGQIGNNSTNPAPLPTTVQGITDAVSVSAGAFFTCAVQAGGTASCWGANDSGELSAIDSVDHLTPTLVGSSRFCIACGGTVFLPLSGVAAIATGTSTSLPTLQHACALLASGVMDCWGNNVQGEVGDGTTVNQPRPTVVNSFAANVDASATLRNDRIAEVTALINCEIGDQAHISLTLEQGGSSGMGHAEASCESRLIQVPMTVPAQGPFGFQPGTATAHVEAIVRSEGAILEDTHWTRQVVLSASKKDGDSR